MVSSRLDQRGPDAEPIRFPCELQACLRLPGSGEGRVDGKHDGIDAALVLFRAYGVRCIFATGVTNPQARERAAPAAPLAWLQKPFSMNALISAVDDALAEIAKQD